jgi:tetratricopeptide (TPR) repeat protein
VASVVRNHLMPPANPPRARAAREQGEVDQALRLARDALEIALSLRNHSLEGYWLITLGNAQQAAGQYADALSSYQRSAMLHRRLGDRSREALAWRGAGETYLRLDRPAEAAASHRQAAAVHHELGDAWNHGLELACLATALLPHDPEAARRHWTESPTRLAPYDDPRAARTRDHISQRLAGTAD